MRVLTCPASCSATRRGTGNTPPIYNSGANLQLPCDVLQVDEISTDPVRQDSCRISRQLHGRVGTDLEFSQKIRMP